MLKSIIKTLLPISTHPYVIKCYSQFIRTINEINPKYKGNKYYCPCCNQYAGIFADYKYSRTTGLTRFTSTYKQTICPYCWSFPRYRMLCGYLKDNIHLIKNKKVLMFSLEQPTIEFFNRYNIEFTTADLFDKRADMCVNIEDIPFDDNSFDFIICNHVLEHPRDYKKSINELYRVLKPGGILEVAVPIDPTYPHLIEDMGALTAEQRIERFGESSHFRIFGTDFADVLKAVSTSGGQTGFDVQVICGDSFDSKIRAVTGPANYDVNWMFICRK